MIVPYLFLKTFAILLAKIPFISDTHTIITARVNKLLKLQSGEFEILFLDYINQEFSSYPSAQKIFSCSVYISHLSQISNATVLFYLHPNDLRNICRKLKSACM